MLTGVQREWSWAGPRIAGTGALLGALGAALYLAVLTGSPGALILVYLAQLPLFAAGSVARHRAPRRRPR